MNRVYIYLSGFFVCITLFSLIFFFSFENLKYEVEENQKEQQANEQGNTPLTAKNGTNQEEPDPALEVDTTQKAVISLETEYKLEIYDSEKDVVEEQVLTVPSDLIGMDREELSNYLDAYMENISLDEYLDGLLSYEIVSFSADKIVLRKTYRPDEASFKFYIASVNNEVVVYYSDKKTVYDYTGIDATHLSSDEQVRLGLGFMVKDLEELYGILENYSS